MPRGAGEDRAPVLRRRGELSSVRSHSEAYLYVKGAMVLERFTEVHRMDCTRTERPFPEQFGVVCLSHVSL